MEKHSSEDIYNVNKYTDIELFQVLDLINPSDRELEAKIIQMINKYQNIKNESGSQLYRFFNDIYNHFFENSDDELVEEGLGERKIDYSGPESQPNRFGINNIINSGVNTLTYGTTLGFGNTVVSGNTISYGTEVNSNTVVGKTIDVNTDYRKDGNVSLTKPLDYSKDTLNPLLKQTVRRIISIDSSYRPNSKDISTEFTFNLSEPLKDVLSLKLYSVQIPYTWYTISEQFGSNYFYLKGNSDGINNGNHDYKIQINAGNYTQVLLVEEINKSIQIIDAFNQDVEIGNTRVIYVPSTQLATINVDITKLYNESNYYVYFPNWTPPTDSILRNDSIPGFLGYNYTQYSPCVIYSNRNNLPLTNTNDTDSRASVFSINGNNRFFTIKQYTNSIGYGEYTNTSRVDWSYNIYFNNANISDGIGHSRQTLYNDINTQLKNDKYLINSYIERVDITDPSLGYRYYFYKMFIQLNPKTTPNIKNSKTIVIFPDEPIGDSNINTIWTGQRSCFSFDTPYNELNNIISETQTIQTNYIVGQGVSILLECININYEDQLNDYIITIPNSNASGYTLYEYLNAINNAIVTTNNGTKNTQNVNGIFNINGNDYANSNTNVVIDDSNGSKIRFRFDINKIFDETMYDIIFENDNASQNTFLSKSLGFQDGRVILSENIILTSEFNASGSGYTIDPSTTPYLITIKPSADTNYGNGNANVVFNVRPFNPNSTTYSTLKEMENDINLAFSQFADDDDHNVLKDTTIIFTIINDNTVRATLTVVVSKILTQNDYKLTFRDTAASSGTWEVKENSWYNFLKIPKASFVKEDYLEVDSYAEINGESAIYANEIILNDESKNNFFYIKPMPNADGVYTANNTNDIKIDIPYGTYTRSQLITIINTKLSNNVITQGSSISIFTKESNEYTKFRVNINKIYTANDYRLVFYDPYSFVKCYIGSKSAKNTTWDSTVGWVLGFRTLTEYNLLKSNEEVDPNDNNIIYYNGTSSYYSSNSISNVVSITGDTAVCVNLYNYFLIVLDDYTQSHLNDGLVTITSTETDIQLPSYANRHVTSCDPIDATNTLIPFTGNSGENGNVNSLTQKEIYATNEKIAARKNKIKSYSSGPFVNDIFALVPMKTSGLQNGSTYIEFGGTLQNQDRTYFGPVNIRRMSVKLMNERGDVVDLNGANWSFSLMCEQLYQQRTL